MSDYAQIGDVILIIWSESIYNGLQFTVVAPSKTIKRVPQDGDAWIILTTGLTDDLLFVPIDHYQIMKSTRFAKVGETIKISWDKWKGDERFVVIERPDNAFVGDKPGDAWFKSADGTKQFFAWKDYSVVKPDKMEKNVDVFLKKQLDDNLASIFA